MAAGMLATIVLAVCGTAVAGALPAPLQQLAHTFGAPAPDQPGHPAPVISGSSGETGLAPSPAASAGYPTASPPSTPQTHGKSASAPGQTKATATTATTPAASPTATATSTGNGNSGGNGKVMAAGTGTAAATARVMAAAVATARVMAAVAVAAAALGTGTGMAAAATGKVSPP